MEIPKLTPIIQFATASFALGLATSLVLGRRAEPMPTDWSALMRSWSMNSMVPQG